VIVMNRNLNCRQLRLARARSLVLALLPVSPRQLTLNQETV
jgi:hypothetical protein